MFLETWCEEWQLQINVSKTKYLNFNNKRTSTQFDYTLFSVPIENVYTYKYLGLHFTPNLSWEPHINHVTAKANQTLGSLRRHLHLATRETKLIAYTSLLRPKLEYASLIWNPHQSYLIDKLEAIQNRATRFVLRNYTRTSITTLKQQTNIPLLADRRKITRLTALHHLYYHSPSKKEKYCPAANHVSARTDNSQKLQLVTPKTNTFKFSPLQLSISDWNSLPDDIVTVKESIRFRSAIATLYNT